MYVSRMAIENIGPFQGPRGAAGRARQRCFAPWPSPRADLGLVQDFEHRVTRGTPEGRAEAAMAVTPTWTILARRMV
ncbi:hypothetical protein AMK30_08280 [Streptomyces sp. CB02460]|nr:hypothetical protein AMK30_08280 [Streptomyces sp. CB02460]